MAGYSETPLTKKLGLKENTTVFIVNAPNEYFDWLAPLPSSVQIKKRISSSLDFAHVFATDSQAFQENFLKVKAHLKPSGMVWISWPKKTSKVPTDLDENVIRDFGLANGMVDVKVCAVNEVWSGLKFVFRLKDR